MALCLNINVFEGGYEFCSLAISAPMLVTSFPIVAAIRTKDSLSNIPPQV